MSMNETKFASKMRKQIKKNKLNNAKGERMIEELIFMSRQIREDGKAADQKEYLFKQHFTFKFLLSDPESHLKLSMQQEDKVSDQESEE